MCMWFWGYPSFILSTFSAFLTYLFQGPVIIRIDILWAQLLLDFSTDHLENMHTCSTWSEDVHVVLGLSSIIFFQLFAFF